MSPHISMLTVTVIFIFFVSSHSTKTFCFFFHCEMLQMLACILHPTSITRHSSVSLHVTKEHNALLKKTH